MTGKTLCIVIALMVLSVSAILVANPSFLGGFSSTLNGVPIEVKISRQDNGTITTMRTEDLTEDLVENWADYDRQFVRFMGTVKSVDRSEPKEISLRLDLDDADVKDDNRIKFEIKNLSVHLLDAPYLPTEYQERHVYEFTGLLIVKIFNLMDADLDVYAFEIRHHGESESLRADRLEEEVEEAAAEIPSPE